MRDYIGRYVKEFESGNRGSLTLNSCGNDWGLSCGSYQLTLRWGNCIKFLKKYFPEVAKDLYFNNLGDIATRNYPGPRYCSSPTDVKKVWMLCYESVGEDKFFEYEHEYIQNSYYEPLMKKLVGLFNPNNHSRALQECCWSWSVHKGSEGAYKAIKELSKDINLQTSSVEVLLKRFYDYRYNVNKYTRYSSERGSERIKLLGIKNMQPLTYKGSNPSSGASVNMINSSSTITNSNKWTVPFSFRIACKVLNIRKEPNSSSECVGQISDKLKYTIVEVKGNWGKLKSEKGWVSLDYITKC